MYLFQRFGLFGNNGILTIYIPLCIYFNIMTVLAIQTAVIHLHSTMYLFQLLAIWLMRHSQDNLHSTMYLFQHDENDEAIDVITYLHSTMYLFQLMHSELCSAVHSIYIPLCIYFNHDAACNGTAPEYIYIPLCIYFNSALQQL